MKYRIFLIIGMICCITSMVFPETLTIKSHGKVVKNWELKALSGAVAVQPLTTNNPYFEDKKQQKRVYEGFELKKLLTKVYGNAWKKEEELLLTCLDGYQASIPTAEIKKHKGFLVFKEKAHANLVPFEKNDKGVPVELGPFYLVWETIQDKKAASNSWLNWTYQVNTFDLISFRERFPNMAPPKSASRKIKNGFMNFRQHCMGCHMMNGEGGEVGPELNYPVSVLEYFRPGWVERYINNPQSIRFNSKMVVGTFIAKKRKGTIKDIIAYMKMMVKHKRKPAAKSSSGH